MRSPIPHPLPPHDSDHAPPRSAGPQEYIEAQCPNGSTVIVDETNQLWLGPHWRQDSLVSQVPPPPPSSTPLPVPASAGLLFGWAGTTNSVPLLSFVLSEIGAPKRGTKFRRQFSPLFC